MVVSSGMMTFLRMLTYETFLNDPQFSDPTSLQASYVILRPMCPVIGLRMTMFLADLVMSKLLAVNMIWLWEILSKIIPFY